MAEGVADLSTLTKEERVLLTAAQACFPCVERPFAALGEKVGLSEYAVLERLESLKVAGVIRKIGPVFEPARFGLVSELVGAEVGSSHIETVGAEVGSWAPVTHCYEREHRINLWFAAVVPGEDWFESAAARAASMSGVRGVWRLPALRRFKIAVHFDLVTSPSEIPNPPVTRLARSSLAGGPTPAARVAADAVDVDLLSVLETDLPLRPAPFAVLDESAQMEAATILTALQQWKADGRIRRYGAMVNHRRLGFTANSMTAWEVAADRVEEVGNCLASSPYVSHCYERPAFPGFPYNVYAMIHGRSRQECLNVVDSLSKACGTPNPAALFSTREFKKSSSNYARLLAERAARDESQGDSHP